MFRGHFLSFLIFLFGMPGVGLADCVTREDIVEELSCIPGITFREVLNSEDPKIPSGYRRFEIQMEQPVDHFDESFGKFTQRLALLHKDESEPLVLQTSGYQIFTVALTQLAATFGANQLQVEHRFFDQSTPAIATWNKLDILQSAHDFHRITQAFRTIYKGRWVNTGASKGGMTSVFYRRFFPGDIEGTVADVAPLSFSTSDPRYIDFVRNVGGKAYESCRKKLEDLQISLLKRRLEIMPLISGSFVYLGGKSVAFEHAIIELPFVFWQYKTPMDDKVGCDKIPDPQEKAVRLNDYLKAVNEVTQYGDMDLISFMPYYFQAATQLGSPAGDLIPLDPYLLHSYSIDQYTPHVDYKYSDEAMRDIENWVRTQGEKLLFVYGEFDPWSAGAYPNLSCDAKDYHWFQVPGGNHSAKLFKLPDEERKKALGVVQVWMDKTIAQELDLVTGTKWLEEYEFEQRQRYRQ